MISHVVFASHNDHKIAEMRELLAPTGWTISGVEHLEVPHETGTTFFENAALKARFAAETLGTWSLADDSGLCVRALDDAPGVDTASYGGWEKLIHALHGEPNRSARFICVLALCSPQGEVIYFDGICEGQIADAGRGSGTFGYDPVFIPEGDTRTFAEMTRDEKAKFSHRARAVEKLLLWNARHD
jgi:XTP/dITP diphosphohydrolase